MNVITPEFARRLENAELAAWLDMFRRAPADFAEEFGLETRRVGEAVIFLCRKIPFAHFNSIHNFGFRPPAGEESLAGILGVFASEKIPKFYFHYNPFLRPETLPEMLAARNLTVRGGWDRIYRDDAPLEPEDSGENLQIVKVGPAEAARWAHFVSDIYGLPTAPWLFALAGLQEWHHYVAIEDGNIVAARTMYLDPHEKTAWLGVEAPVPGIMVPSFDTDFRICREIVRDGLRRGAKLFVADIEKTAPARDSTPYRNFAALGFKTAYRRQNYMP